jgi:HD-like signal output (HDOD) protein/CheY-like chemotaxis protein
VQRLLMLALTHQGFECDHASDGREAEACIAAGSYDAVVTDLRMPNKHGHALAMTALGLKRPPVVVVHTSVIEPKLAKDLLTRGVDDIVFKPSDFGILAIKVKSLVDRRRSAAAQAAAPQAVGANAGAVAQLQVDVATSFEDPIALANVESKLAGLSQILPISKAALDVYHMTGTNQWETPQVAAAIQRDASLTAEVLRLANSGFYNPSGQRIIQLERAVVQIGQKRIGELALAINSLSALTSAAVPWMDIAVAWKQSMAAGIAVEMLVEQGRHQAVEAGLQLSAIMHPLGRVILGSLYPKHYEVMLERCQENNDALQEHERHMFPLSHAEVASHLLATWNVPAEVHLPLRYLQDDYHALRRVSEPTRIQAEIVKLASLIGRIAVGQWETWDTVELPPATLLKRLGIRSVPEIIDQTRHDVDLLAMFRTIRPRDQRIASAPLLARELAYCDLSGSHCDFLGALLPSMGIMALPCAEDELDDVTDNVLVNCIGVASHRIAAKVRRTSPRKLLIVTDAEGTAPAEEHGQEIAFPTSYGRLRTACWEIARTNQPSEAGARSPGPR